MSSEGFITSFHFDGNARWVRFGFECPVSFTPHRLARRELHEEDSVRINGMTGAAVVWCRVPPDSRVLEAHAQELESGKVIPINLELQWPKLSAREGTYMLPGECFLNVEGGGEQQFELRVWRTTPQQLSTLKSRPARSGPVKHTSSPDWTLKGSSAIFEFAAVVDTRPGLLYLELWEGEDWVDATWVDAGGIGLLLLSCEDGRNTVLAFDLVEGRALDQLSSLTTLEGGQGVFAAPPESLELVNIGASMVVVRWPGGETCFPHLLQNRRAPDNERVVILTDRLSYQRDESVAFFGWCRQRPDFGRAWRELPGKHLHYCLSYADSHQDRREGCRSKLERTPWGGFWGETKLELNGDRERGLLEVVTTDWEGHKTLATRSLSQQRYEYAESGAALRLEGLEVVVKAFYATGEPIPDSLVELTLSHRGVPFYPGDFRSYSFHHEARRETPLSPEFEVTPPSWEETLRLTTDQKGVCRATIASLKTGEFQLVANASALVSLPEGRRVRVGASEKGEPPDILYPGLKVWGNQYSLVVVDARGQLLSNCQVRVWQDDEQSHELAFCGEVVHRVWPRRPGRLYVTVVDEFGRKGSSSLVISDWTGPLCTHPFPVWPSLRLERTEYEEGETVALRLFQDGGPALAWLRVFSDEMVYQESRTLVESVSNWEFALDQRCLGGCLVRVDLLTRHGHRCQLAKFRVRPTRYLMSVEVSAPEQPLAYGETAAVTVGVKTPGGAPAVGADVILVALDVAAIGRGYGDLVSSFYRNVPPCVGVSTSLGRSSHFRTQSEGYALSSYAPEPAALQAVSFAFREVEEPLVFLGFRSADEEGWARFEFPLKATPGRYEVAALVAHQWDCFGWGTAEIRCQQPQLTLRLSHPDYLWRGDRPLLPVRWQCKLDRERGELHYRALGLDPEEATLQINLAARELPLELEAVEAGQAKLQLVGQVDSAVDRLEVSFPVYEPEIPCGWSDWGVLGDGPVDIPLRWEPGWDPELTLEVWTADPAHELTEALGRGESAFEVALRVLTYLWVGDLRGPEQAQIPGLEASLYRLRTLQQVDGSFLSRVGGETADFVSALCSAVALREAQRVGHEVDEVRFQSSLDWLKEKAVSEDERARQTMPSPWRGWFDHFLSLLDLPHFRTRSYGNTAISPVGQLGTRCLTSGPIGEWTLLEDRDELRDRLYGDSQIQLLRQVYLSQFEKAQGVFRFGDSARCLGELVCQGNEATRWRLPPDLDRLRLEFEGKGQLFYRIIARGVEPPGQRSPGFGVIYRVIDGKLPDENGYWHFEVGKTVEVEIRVDLPRAQGLICYLPKPACFVDDTQMAVLCNTYCYQSFTFRLQVRYPGDYTFPPAWVESKAGVVARTDWHRLVVR